MLDLDSVPVFLSLNLFYLNFIVSIILFFIGHSHNCGVHSNVEFWEACEIMEETNNNDRMEWEADRRLTWDDFQAKPPSRWSTDIAAITSSVIQYRYVCENGLLDYEIRSIFLKDESWVMSSSTTAAYLQHEQLHFDLTELFARKLKSRLSKKVYKCNEVGAFEKLVNDTLAEWRKTQQKYDWETGFSLRKTQQEKWNQKVPGMIAEYDEFQ